MGFAYYDQDTIETVSEQIVGLRVDTGVLANLSYWHQDQWEIFNVYGVIKVLNLFAESTVIDGAPGATILQLNYTSATPAIVVQDLSAVSLTLATLVVGDRLRFQGTNITTAPVSTGTACITDGSCPLPMILGTEGGTATIGFVTTVADATAGSHQWSIFYVPMSDGASVTNVI